MGAMERRRFLSTVGTGVFLGAFGTLHALPRRLERVGGPKIKLSLNAYSFNQALRSGSMTLTQLLDFSAEQNFDAVDLTGYYFPGYPAVPSDEVVNSVKRQAYVAGLAISGTGVRNDFRNPDPEKRKDDIRLVCEWIELAARLGAPALRIFAGRDLDPGQDRRQATRWVVDSIRECLPVAARNGVVLVLQNHFEFLKTPEQTLELLEIIDSEWLAMNLDIGSYRGPDPYAEVRQVAPYATTWQIKENVFVNNVEEPTDLGRVVEILREVDFRGYILVETLGEGDPYVKVPRFLESVRKALA